MNSKAAEEEYARGLFNAFLAYRKKHGGNITIPFQAEPESKEISIPQIVPQNEVREEPPVKKEPKKEVKEEPVKTEELPVEIPEGIDLSPVTDMPKPAPAPKETAQPVQPAQPVVEQPVVEPVKTASKPAVPVFKAMVLKLNTIVLTQKSTIS